MPQLPPSLSGKAGRWRRWPLTSWAGFPILRYMTALEERQTKSLLKVAMVEVLEERPDLLPNALQESLEDLGMLKAIREGEKSRLTTRKRIFKRFDRPA
jgi:hypothetical protein